LLCERTSPDTISTARRPFARRKCRHRFWVYGEWLGDIEIIKPVIVLRSAVLYEATHQKKKRFSESRSPGPPKTKERLKREAEFSAIFSLTRPQISICPVTAALCNTILKARCLCRKTNACTGHLLYFNLFETCRGRSRSAILITENPQLWINHIC